MINSRHAVAVSLCLIAVLTGAHPALANDTTIPCKDPPKASASVAVHSGTQVSITQDKQKETCIFSINGAVATSPPSEDVMKALNLFSGGKRPPIDDTKVMASAVAALLAAPAPVDKVPDEIVLLLTKADKGFRQCLTDFFDKKALPSNDPKQIGFTCKGLAPYKDAGEKARLIGAGEPAVGAPTLMIVVEWGEGRHFISALYLPR